MKKKLLMILMLALPFTANAEETPFPSTAKGIQIVPLDKQALPAKLKKDILTKQAQENLNGYQLNNGENALFLLNIKRNAPQEIAESRKKSNDVYDTHLKSNYSEIKLAFPFKGLPSIDEKDIIGYAAIGSFVKENDKEGWTGIRAFFNSSMGTCSYSYMEIQAVQLAQETTEYLVNKKPSNKLIEGNLNSGFVYSVNWYTDNSMKTLECANKKLDQEIMKNVISLANKVDKS